MNPPPVTVVIPVFNEFPLTAACLESLAAATAPDAIQVVVVDNGSVDETAGDCPGLGREMFPNRFSYLRQDQNQNFGPACNLGAETAESDFLFFLNNDTILTDGWLDPLLQAFQNDPSLGAVGPLLLYPENERVQHVGICFDPEMAMEHLYEFFPAEHPAVRKSGRPLQALTAAAMLIPTAVFRDCGGFFPEYRNGYEDLDLCCVLRKAGRNLRCVPNSIVLHYGSRSWGRFEHESHNIELLHSRHADCFTPDLHAHGRSDGYAIQLTPWLQTYLSLPRERETELAVSMDTPPNPQRCFDLLQAEPLWESGYTLLADLLERNKLWPEALELRFLQARFFPLRTNVDALRHAAVQAGDHELAGQCAARLQTIDSLMADTDALQAKAAQLAELFREQGEEDLAWRYEHTASKLAEHT